MVDSATRNSMIVNICTAISYLQDTRKFLLALKNSHGFIYR